MRSHLHMLISFLRPNTAQLRGRNPKVRSNEILGDIIFKAWEFLLKNFVSVFSGHHGQFHLSLLL